ncbi:MAG: TonB-dependent receptor [Kangiellaceae bacterium]|nr:TonB-dependent receptor [Kangiellaceae bacterium]MCW9000560.1 TonB-dependent receptor [Kangiellaceae bacterium]MCW9017647.1 TonB-dependent receptor [Kangiellaceae bacterium]
MAFRLKLLALSIALAFSAQPVAADELDEEEFEEDLEDFYGDEDFVSLATGTKQLIHKAPSVASVVTKDQIKSMGLLDLDEILETIPGFHVSRNKAGNEPVYVIRGVTTRFNPQVLMLLNGIPLTNIYVGNRGQVWGGFPVESIERVEVIRGPGSALYGADAFSGVINIITKDTSSESHVELGGRIGSFNSQSVWLTSTGTINDAAVRFDYQYYQTDGHEEIVEADAQSQLDLIFGTDASYAPGPMSNMRETHEFRSQIDFNNWKIRVGAQYRKRGLGIGVTGALTPTSRSFSNRWNFDINYKTDISDNSKIDFQISRFNTSLEIDGNLILFPPGSDIGFGAPFPDGVIGNPEVFENHNRANFTYTYSGYSSHSLRLGTGYYFSEIYKTKESKNFALGPNGEFLAPGSPVVDVSDTPYVFLPEEDRKNLYVFIQDVWQVANDWEVTFGLRHDDYSDFGTTTNPRFAVVWSTSFKLTSKLLYGKAFRAPSMANLYAINNPAALGNPDVQPEKMETLELVFDYRPTDDLTTVFSIFKYNWDDVIQFSPDEGLTTTTAKNIGQRSGQGFEVEATWEAFENLTFSTNFSYQDSEDDDTGFDLVDVPRQQFYLMADWKISSNWSSNFQIHSVMERKRASSDTREKIDDNSWLDLNVHWKNNENDIEFAISGKNVFDAELREPLETSIPNDLPLAGRSVHAELRYHF